MYCICMEYLYEIKVYHSSLNSAKNSKGPCQLSKYLMSQTHPQNERKCTHTLTHPHICTYVYRLTVIIINKLSLPTFYTWLTFLAIAITESYNGS